MVTTTSVEETEAAGCAFGKVLTAGAVVALLGDLGAGKTAFARGVAAGLGIDARVTSPTFALVNEYQGKIPLFHFDLYRLPGADELYDLGLDEYLERGGVCLMEWAERVIDELSFTHTVTITALGETVREITMEVPDDASGN